ncbi:TPA: phage baseplate protein [Escherichia coli]
MAYGALTIGRPTESQVNSTSNDSTGRSTKGDNGFAIITSTLGTGATSAFEEYQALSFDAVESIKVNRNADVTSYAVQDGAMVSDHVQIKNNKFSLQGRISETVLKLNPDMLKSSGINGNRRALMIEYLNQVMDSRQPFMLVTEHKNYENVVLVGMDYEEEASESLLFNLEFEQIRLVNYATTSYIATKTQTNKSTGGSVKTKVNPTPQKAPTSTGQDVVTPVFKQ